MGMIIHHGKEQEEGEGGKTTPERGQDWTFQRHRGLWETDSDGGRWLVDYLGSKDRYIDNV